MTRGRRGRTNIWNTESNDLNETIDEKICKSFGDTKCPLDPYCFNDNISDDDDSCRFCPSGNEYDCSYYSGGYWYEKCEIQGQFKYYAGSIRIMTPL